MLFRSVFNVKAATPAWTLNTGTSQSVCDRYNSMYKTSYAPDDPYTDVNWNNPQPVSTGVNHGSCQEGSVPQNPFLDDALRRMNFYRWMVGLQYASIDTTKQSHSQECALMMAKNYNQASPDYHYSSVPHSSWPNWVCATNNAKQMATDGNIYAGQSLAGLNWMWQTTPAHILAGFVSDFSSSKVGHRQNVLCPNLDDVSFGHVCYKESQTTRHFCGGCQHAYGRNSNTLPPKVTCSAPSGFVAWPPHGAVPTTVLSTSSNFQWSFATLEPVSGAFNSFTVEVNGQVKSASRVYALCTGSGMADAAGRSMVHIVFKPGTYSVGSTISVVVRASSYTWSYYVTPVDCDTSSRPSTVARENCGAPTPPATTPSPTPTPTASPVQPSPPPPPGITFCQAHMDKCWKECGPKIGRAHV